MKSLKGTGNDKKQKDKQILTEIVCTVKFNNKVQYCSPCPNPLQCKNSHICYYSRIVRLGPSPKPKLEGKGLDQSRKLNSHSTHPPTHHTCSSKSVLAKTSLGTLVFSLNSYC